MGSVSPDVIAPREIHNPAQAAIFSDHRQTFASFIAPRAERFSRETFFIFPSS
jgi:hypothetical protein